MATKFFTNADSNTLLNKLEGVFGHGAHIEEFDALVGYFRSTGYFKMRPFLENVPQIRVLVGIDVDVITAKYKRQGLLLAADANSAKQDYLDKLKQEIETANYSQDLEKSILQFIADIASGKIRIKAHPTRKLHAKIYIFRPKNFNPHSACEVITGSSNFTKAGLGVQGNDSNYEFNVSLRDYDDVKFATDEFEKLWNESVDILPEEITKTRDKTFLKDDFTSFELYIKLLIEYFGKEIEFDPNNIKDLPEGFLRLNYQLDAVNQGFRILKKYNGFFLADVVGLGKTIVAILIARQFFYSNNYPEYISKTLIVIPPALKSQWRDTVRKFGLQNVNYITNGRLHKVEHPTEYDLIIVDEAHKFRNDGTLGYEHLQYICKVLCRNGKAKKVILVSATPLNNRPNDIRNQVLLFQDANRSTMDIHLSSFFSRISKRYKEIIENSASGTAANEIYAELRDKVIEPLTVRRTRTDLLRHGQYSQDLEEQGIRFPDVGVPEKLLYPLRASLNQLYDETMRLIKGDEGLQYMRYRAIEFMKIGHRKDYNRPEFISSLLASIMKSLLAKRLDSSFYAFHCTLQRFVSASDTMLKMVDKNRIIIAPNHQVEEYIQEDNEDELLEKLASEKLTDPSIKILSRDEFEPGFVEGLQHDHEILTSMQQKWQKVVEDGEDPKLDKFLSVLGTKLLEESQNPEGKLVIFSESFDTTQYLEKKLRAKQYENVLSVNSTNRDQLREKIEQNFDANILLVQQRSDYNIIITTEVLAEGVNLHRANTILNYDTPWNSTRLMQRIGRINRIGTKADKIHVYNFFPTEKVEGDIQLRHKAIVKLQAFHSTLGEDSQVYSVDEQVETFGLFDKPPRGDGEINERLQYLMEIRRFRKESPEEFRRIKNLPLKIRTAVENSERKNRTITYLRGKARHYAFYSVGQQNDLIELGFLEAASIFKSNRTAQSQPLHEQHHTQVQQAITHLQEQIEERTIRERQRSTLTPRQARAIHYLKAVQALPHISDSEKQTIAKAIETIKLGRFQALERDVYKLQRSAKQSSLTKEAQLESLLEIICRRIPEVENIGIQDEQNAGKNPAAVKMDSEAEVIISQSYV